MAEPATPLMSPAEFFAWQEHQDERYELVGGRPRLMPGATQRHDIVVVNALAAFRSKLRGGPCRPTTDDIAAMMPHSNVRRPDVTIECGSLDPAAMISREPRLFLEVLSPSTVHIDKFVKLEEYKGVASLAYIVIVDATRPHVLAYTRGPDGAWSHLSHLGPDAVIDLPALSCTLPLAELYEDVPLAEPKVIAEAKP